MSNTRIPYVRIIDRLSRRTKRILFAVGCVIAIPVIVFAVFVAVPNLLEGAL